MEQLWMQLEGMNKKFLNNIAIGCTLFLGSLIQPMTIFASPKIDVAPLKLLDQETTKYIGGEEKPVAVWEMPIDQDLLRELGLMQNGESSAPINTNHIQYLTTVLQNESLILQGRSPLYFRNSSNINQISIEINTPTQNRYITLPDRSGEITVLGQTISGEEIDDRGIDLVTKTTGDYVQSVVSGSGIAISGGTGKGITADLSLGDLTKDWIQSAPFDIVINNPDSGLKLIDASGNHFARIAVDTLANDVTLKLSGAGGTLLTDDNFSSLVDLPDGLDNLSGLTDLVAARSNLGLGDIATQNTNDFLTVSNNLSELTDITQARSNLALGDIVTQNSSSFFSTANNLSELTDTSIAQTNLGLGTMATESVENFLNANNNLSEITDSALARSNLALGSIAIYDNDDFFNVSNNLAEITDMSMARGNLGLEEMATQHISSFLQTANSLSEVDPSTARTNLGLGDIATQSIGSFLQVSNNLAEIDPMAARINLGLGSSAIQNANAFLQTTNNLSEIADPSIARMSLGLGTIATQPLSNFVQTTNNLSDISNTTIGRTNLGLGSIATQSASSIALTGGTLNGVAIGATTPANAAFSTLTSSGNTVLGSSGSTTIGNGSSTVQISSNGLNISSSGAISGVTGYTQSSGNFALSGNGSLTTGTGNVSINGDTTVASGKTVNLTSNDSLRVGGSIVPQTVTIVVPMLATLSVGLNDQVVFVSDNVYALAGARCVYSAAASIGANLQVTVDAGTAAPGTGTDQLTASINLGSTLNTVYTGTVIGSPTPININDKVSIDFSGTLIGILGSCTITLKRT